MYVDVFEGFEEANYCGRIGVVEGVLVADTEFAQRLIENIKVVDPRGNGETIEFLTEDSKPELWLEGIQHVPRSYWAVSAVTNGDFHDVRPELERLRMANCPRIPASPPRKWPGPPPDL